MIKVLGLALYGQLAASTRHRLWQYVPGLANMGIELQIYHLLDDEYLFQRFRGGRLPLEQILKSGVNRLLNLCRQNEFDIVMLHCELFPLLPGFIERAMIHKPYIYDLDDAFYLKYRRGRLGFASPILGKKFEYIMRGATVVTAGNNVLANYASQYNNNIHYLPTVIDTDRYKNRPIKQENEVFTVGWIGSPSTAVYLSEISESLSIIGLEGPVQFIVIGGKAPKVPNVNVVELDWSENTEIELISAFDVGVMPLPDDDWARGKCAFKLIQYMACAVPVIASPIGANIDVVNSQCGLMASNKEEWTNAFREFRDNYIMRIQMGISGRKRIFEKYSLNKNLPLLAKAIHQTLGV